MKAIAIQKPFSMFRDAIRKPPKPVLIVGVVIVVLAAAALCIKLLPRQPEARYELPASDGEVDFDAPDTYTYKDDLGNEVTIHISQAVHDLVESEPNFERRVEDERKGELDIIFSRIYEDNTLGKLPDSQYQKLPMKYQEEYDILLEQKVEIHFNFTGEVGLPDVEQRHKLLKSFGKEKREQIA